MTEDLKLSRRGRKPLGDRAMTPAEAKRRSRERQAQQGFVEFMVRASGQTLELVDKLATHNGQSRSEVVEALLQLAATNVVRAMEAGQAVAEEVGDVANEAVSAAIRAELTDVPTTQPHNQDWKGTA